MESNNDRKHIRLEKKHGVGVNHNQKPNLGYWFSALIIWVFMDKSPGLSKPQFLNKMKGFDEVTYGYL